MTAAIAARNAALVDRAREAAARQRETTPIRIRVGSATCENAAGAAEVYDEFARHIRAAGRRDIRLYRTGCTGRCSCEPIVGVMLPGQAPVQYSQVDRDKAHEIFTSHVQQGTVVSDLVLDGEAGGTHRYQLFFCGSQRCARSLGRDLGTLCRAKLAAAGIDEHDVGVVHTHCFGLCPAGPENPATPVLVRPGKVLYRVTGEADLDAILTEHVGQGRPVDRLRLAAHPVDQGFFDLYGDVAFFHRQTRLALRNSGVIDPESLDDYLRVQGFAALAAVLERQDPAGLIAAIDQSRLRGRGGGGYPTGLKWRQAAESPDAIRYLVCNADEGDPGAFMDRSMLEGDPFSVLEGMLIAGYAIGARQGYFYVRAEYPLAVGRITRAIEQARAAGLLGADILGSGYDFDVQIRLGAGAFVCGEETALIQSIEGGRGEPRVRPPYPTTQGLFGHPTVINNVETLANVPVIVHYGASWFHQIGTERSGGTKVFALAGKVRHTGLVEVPMGATLRQIVFDIGGGPPPGKTLKAIQTGGPSGGCLPAACLDTAVDFDALSEVGSIMGSGGMIAMDEDDCMVDIARFFLSFTQNESCGKCTPCREGTKRMLEILERITTGKGVPEDLERLARLGGLVKKASLCGLGRAAPNPVLSTLRHYRHEYEAHIHQRRCPAHRCVALIHYEIDTDRCVGCTVCARACPVGCITGLRQEAHAIDQQRCIKCGRCAEACRFDAVAKL